MSRRRGHVVLAVLVIAALALPAGGAATAAASPAPSPAATDRSRAGPYATCVFDAGAAKVTVTLTNNSSSIEIADIVRSGDAIVMNASPCGAATVNNTDTIEVKPASNAVQSVFVDESGGAFAPGKSTEASGVPEIEFTVDLGTGSDTAGGCGLPADYAASHLALGDNLEVSGTADPDTVRVGGIGSPLTYSVNLNGDDDADIVTTNVESVTVDGVGGADDLSGQGGQGTGAALPFQTFLTLSGGPGDDSLTGGGGANCFTGGPGDDDQVGNAGHDLFIADAGPDGADEIVGAGGPFDVLTFADRTVGATVDLDNVADDGAAGEGDNAHSDVEYLIGGTGNDKFTDNSGVLAGRQFFGGLGDDTLMVGLGGSSLWGCYPNEPNLIANAKILACTADGNDKLNGGPAGDEFHGGYGNDVEVGGPGNQVDRFNWSSFGLTSDYGADDISGGDGPDVVNYGDRTRPITVTLADGQANDGEANEHDNVHADVETVYGSSSALNQLTGADVANALLGGDAADVIKGLGGNDVIESLGAADVVFGGPGVDTIHGGTGDDALHGDAGNDVLTGDNDQDTLDGGPGDDLVQGWFGDDVFDERAAPSGSDELQGGPGVDTADYSKRSAALKVTIDTAPTVGIPPRKPGNDGDVAAAEHDNVTNDTENVVGGSAKDVLTGSDPAAGVTGDNRLAGGGGADIVSGLGGNDVLEGGSATDVIKGGTGTDAVSYADHDVRVVVTLNGLADDGADANGDGNSEEDDQVASDVEGAIGGEAGDKLTGNSGANMLDGGPGNDLLVATSGASTTADGPDRLIGGDGRDTVSYAARTKSVIVRMDGLANDGEDANSDGTAEEGDNVDATVEVVTGGHDDDLLVGSDAAQTFKGAEGDDRIDGGLGTDDVSGGPGSDTAVYASHTANVVATLDGAANDGQDADHDGVAEEADLIEADVENLTGGSGNDRLTGNADANRVDGGPGADTLDGGLGADDLVGGDGIDVADYSVRAVPVTVTIDGLANDGEPGEGDVIAADVEGVQGGSADDSLTGGPGANTLLGGDGNDALAGLGGNDILEGEDGDDVLAEGSAPNGQDTLSGGAGVDLADYGQRTGAVTVRLDGSVGDGEAAELDNVLPDVEDVTTGSGNDTLAGSSDDNVLDGGAGNDQMSGGSGNDLLVSGLGPDTMNGDAGSDAIDQGSALDGGDLISGGPGIDVLDYGERTTGLSVSFNGAADDGDDVNGDGVGEEADRVLDAEIVLGGSAGDRLVGTTGIERLFGNGGPDVLTGNTGNDRLYGGPGDDVLTGGPACPAVSCPFSDRDGLYGGDGDDLLNGGTGPDVLFGDDGNDVVYGDDDPASEKAPGVDVIEGGPGSDALHGRGGDDMLFAEDGEEDTVAGDDGNDTAGDYDDGVDLLSSIEHS